MSEQKNINDYIKTLEALLDKLESGDITIEESMVLYKQGKTILVTCQDMITTMEKELTVIGETELLPNKTEGNSR